MSKHEKNQSVVMHTNNTTGLEDEAHLNFNGNLSFLLFQIKKAVNFYIYKKTNTWEVVGQLCK